MRRTAPMATLAPVLGLLALLAACGCIESSDGAPGSGLRVLTPPDGATGVPLVPQFAWTIPGRPNRVGTVIFNVYEGEGTTGDAAFIRVFDGPVDRIGLNQGQEGMPGAGIGTLEPHTTYTWTLTMSFLDGRPPQHAISRFVTGPAP